MKKISFQKLLLLLTFILLIIAVLLFPYKRALVFQYQNKGTVLAYIPITEKSTFKMKYTHSIHLSDVVESYKITDSHDIQLYELMYEDFAIGMPENASESEVFLQKDGKYYIKNMKRVFPYFDLRTGKVRANHRIIFEQKEYPLSKFIAPGTWIRIKYEKINLLQKMKGVNMLDEERGTPIT